VLTRYALGFTVLARACCQADQIEAAEAMLDEFSATMPVTRDCRVAQAEALAALVATAATKGLFPRAQRFYQALAHSVAQTGQDETFADQQAMAGYVLMISLARARRAEQATAILEEMRGNEAVAQSLERVLAQNYADP
jgi:pentatricopeptide repeat protein